MEIKTIHLTKSYGCEKVIEDWNFTFEKGRRYALMGSSGLGKTVFLRLLMGLEQPDEGQVVFGGEAPVFSAVFQEDRLCEAYSAIGNLMAVKERLYEKTAEAVRNELMQLLPEEQLTKKTGLMSGGMRRRVAIVRAMAAASEIVLLDEPFTGLDGENKARAARYILSRQRGRTLIVVTHDKAEAALLDCTILLLTKE